MVNKSLLAGEKDYPDKATKGNAPYQGEDYGDYRRQGDGGYSNL